MNAPCLFSPPAETFEGLRLEMARIAVEVAAVHAADVDRQARFPFETIEALRAARMMSVQLPAGLGGPELGMSELGVLVSLLAEQCASSAMVLAMHFNQVACLTRHGLGDPLVQGFLMALGEHQYLVASMTSEVGTSGEVRRSICSVHQDAAGFRLEKAASTGSYCEQADAILVTARRNADASPNDQVLVLVKRDQRHLVQTTTWDTLGMRGTCSPGFHLSAAGPAGQVLSAPFGEIAVMSMVPYSHILWSALWTGIATGACDRAASCVRQQARNAPGSVPAGAQRLAALGVQLQAMRRNWESAAHDFDAVEARGYAADELAGRRWALRMNNLKVASSEAAPAIVHGALLVIGIAAYKNDGPLSLGRAYRDSLSGALMISNDRLNAASAAMLLVSRGM